ncbi:MAG: DUF4062 domain-containing protein, partial [Mariprofundus sp.]|nr:DUF4062 domain-containing protein [Mariprofundus sp.]
MTQVFRVFISSTFSDFSSEREVLQQNVFLELDRYCQSRGYYFQPIDLRWGVTEEAQLDQKTLELCLTEVKTCKHFPHPNFLIMSGNWYGWIPLPYLIEESEFGLIWQGVEDDTDKQLLKEWYLLDLNQLPASYVLKERAAPYDDSTEWADVEDRLRTILQNCVLKLDFPEGQREKYFLSATEQEVNEGIFHYSGYTNNQEKILRTNPLLLDSEKKHVFSFLRDIENHDAFTDSNFVDKDQTDVVRFKQNIKSTLVKENIIELSTKLTEETKLDKEYLAHFESRVADFLKHSIDEQIQELSLSTELEAEHDRQKLHLKNKLYLFSGREADLSFIAGYLTNDDARPLIIHGRSGLGKSSLMAKAINDALRDGSSRTVYRFVGVSPESGNTKDLWGSILREIGYDVEAQDSGTFEQFSLKVHKHLIEISEPTVVFIDAVDQLVNSDTFSWLPEALPGNLKVVISALKDSHYKNDSRAFEVLSNISKNLFSLPDLEIDVCFLDSLLKEQKRKLQAEQSEYVLSKYNEVHAPLYIKIAEQEFIHWKSYDYIDPAHKGDIGILHSLESTQRGVISEFIQNLSAVYHHNKALVTKVMGYIYASVDGLNEKELITLLSMDKKLLQKVAPQTYHKNISGQLPVVIWARLKFQITPFLSLKKVDGLELMQFFHREFNDAIRRMFDVKGMHEDLIDDVYERLSADALRFHANRFGRFFVS